MSASTASPSLGGQPKTIKEILAPLIAIIIGLFMVILDGTVVNVAIPGLMQEFDSTLSYIQWTFTGYALAQAAVIPLAGWLSDRFGPKNIFLISLVLFTIGSLLCALATSADMLIAFRVLQGLGGGVMMPIAMAFTYRLAPPDKVGAVMGMMGIPILFAPAIGPVLGGWLIDKVSWQWIFLINIPIGVIGMIVGLITLPKIGRTAVATLDKLGMLLGPLAFAALSYGVSEGGNSWTSERTIIGLSVGVVALLLFIVAELRKKEPLLELRVFRSFNFSRGIIIQWITQSALFGTMFLIPIFLQQAKHETALDTGLIMLPQAIAAAIFMPIGGKLSDKFGARPLVMVGMAIVTAAAWLLTGIDAASKSTEMLLPIGMLGAGMGLSMMPLNTHLIQSAPANLVSRVTALTNAAQQVVSSIAVAGLTTIMASRGKHYFATGKTEQLEIYSLSFSDTFFVLVAIAAAGTVLSVLLSRPKKSAAGEEAPPEARMMMHG
ncbi:DHA2 family efflux MFS transporter permease subunit [Paenibacillus cymbidii]|uniref:DHA2 family efflux MFS transporter permease subunit n=1 Tax=Paenibacillus cymbidii TaxID=1639034 RepID=UPI001080D3A7|nr:DHA2 family efflux MFS transporter permease subunit [Paenibacillus cymbidii]